ncbi:hypothetical protein K7432_011242 [Basidiobolus ranarum]|uniref:Uncharacterized protein n=1 Tax=Basidiobolus ranarum TaxID=34480 RepID=A0ABR2VUP7_9FUNG
MQLKSFLSCALFAGALAVVHGGGYGGQNSKPQLPDGCVPSDDYGGYECTSVTEGTWTTDTSDYGSDSNPKPVPYKKECKLPKRIALRGDTDKYLGRCRGCAPYSTNPDNAFVHGYSDPNQASYLQWEVTELGNGKIALRSDTGNYMGRCHTCYKQEVHYDSASVHVKPQDLPNSPWAHWTLNCVDDNHITLQADTGNYLSRCRNCISGATYPDSAFVHNNDPKAAYAIWQWTELGKY